MEILTGKDINPWVTDNFQGSFRMKLGFFLK